jgi:hypothetical protein
MSASNFTTGNPPFFEITDIDHGPWAVVVAFCSISLTTFIAVIRFVLAGRMKVKFQLDDLTFAIATVSTSQDARLLGECVETNIGVRDCECTLLLQSRRGRSGSTYHRC